MSEVAQQTQTPTPSRHEGFGAQLYDGGVAFRVWAPHADAVHVTGTFNDWSREATPLAREDGGTWSADVPEANAGDEYLFSITNGEHRFDRVDPYAREVSNSAGNGIIHDPAFDWEGDAFELPSWNRLVLYEMHVGTFNDENEFGPGDLYSATARLDNLRDLGVNVVELMPLAEFAGDYSWGYNPAHPFAVEEAYGGPRALKTFVKEAHARGLGVVLDVVYNHFGPSDLDLWQFDGWSENGKGGIYFYNDHRAATPWGDTRPDYGRPEVRRYILDNVLMWLDDYRLDGLRLDMTPFIFTLDGHYNSHPLDEGWQMMQDISRTVRERYPNRLLIAEDLQKNAHVTASVEHGGAGFGAQWDAAFVHPVREALITSDDEHRSLDAIVEALYHRYGDDAFSRVVYTESHDEVANGQARVPEEIWPGNAESWPAKKRSTLGAVLVLTAPGIPMLFQGQALLEDEYFRDDDPLDWSRLDRLGGIRGLYRDLIALRRDLQGTTRGLTGPHLDVFHRDHGAKVLAYHRWQDGGPADSTVVVLNLSTHAHDAYPITFPRPGRWRLRLNTDWEGYDGDFGNHAAHDADAAGDPPTASVSLGPYTALIFSQDGE